MQITPLISIIIPVYNAEKHIRKCLDSIRKQTYTNWEAILVDDGSPDNCGEICDEYAKKDNRFKVIHQKNGGVSLARQAGLDKATGDYIIHCDPDDWIEPEMLQELIGTAISENAGMVICDIKEYEDGRTTLLTQHLERQQTSKDTQTKIINQQLHGSCCNKLIKKELCKDISFYPSNINMCEDELFNIRVLNKEFNVVYLPEGLYCYNKENSSSVCNSRIFRSIESRMIIISECEKFIDSSLYNNFFAMKRSILQLLLTYKYTDKIATTYPEIHKEILHNGEKYNFLLPLSYFLAMAVKGMPQTAYYLYKINLLVIEILKGFKKRLYKRGNKQSLNS